jgi:Cu-Zn family superoxide dismutase
MMHIFQDLTRGRRAERRCIARKKQSPQKKITGRRIFPTAFVVGLAMLVGAAPASAAASKAHAVARLIGLDGKPVGQANFQQTSHGVLIEIEVHGLQPGAHAIMIHTTGACDPKKLFTSAGPDLSFDATKPHGYLVKGGPRAGDLPNQFAGADGSLHATLLSNAFSLGNGKKTIFRPAGASIIVNARGDDYLSQPDGNAGPRLACGTIIRTVAPGGRRGGARRKHE